MSLRALLFEEAFHRIFIDGKAFGNLTNGEMFFFGSGNNALTKIHGERSHSLRGESRSLYSPSLTSKML